MFIRKNPYGRYGRFFVVGTEGGRYLKVNRDMDGFDHVYTMFNASKYLTPTGARDSLMSLKKPEGKLTIHKVSYEAEDVTILHEWIWRI